MAAGFQSVGRVAGALFTLKLHRGDGMLLLAMNWKNGPPPREFVGFAIQYQEPGGDRFFDLKNRLSFPSAAGQVDPNRLSTMRSPIQKFRWVHFPRNADLDGLFTYRVTPVFMNSRDELSYGTAQEAQIELRRETYPGQLNVTFTRGFVSSQAFVDRFGGNDAIASLLPPSADQGLTFTATHPKTGEALAWMGFEARREILRTLDEAIAQNARVDVVAYDLSEPEIVSRFEQLGNRLRIIIDDDGTHGEAGSGETQAEAKLVATAGQANVKRHHMGKLQHNKMIIAHAPVNKAIGGSTNFSWRGFYVQANNAVILEGAQAIVPFATAFNQYWASSSASAFGGSGNAVWQQLPLPGIDAKVTFSPHDASNAMLASIAADLTRARSSVLYSLAFLFQTPGVIQDAIRGLMPDPDIFMYGISDKKVSGLQVSGIELALPSGNIEPMRPSALTRNVPEPFKSEAKGGGGNRMHHKFIVIDFDKPTARVYLGSYNFSNPADRTNGENLFLFKDRRIATAYMVEAIRLFDHYHFRVVQETANRTGQRLMLQKPPQPGQPTWFADDYTDPRKIKDREIFA